MGAGRAPLELLGGDIPPPALAAAVTSPGWQGPCSVEEQGPGRTQEL